MNEQASDAETQADSADLPSLTRRVSISAVILTEDAKQGEALTQAGIINNLAVPLVPDGSTGIEAVLEIALGADED
jgi:hypothetical protein